MATLMFTNGPPVWNFDMTFDVAAGTPAVQSTEDFLLYGAHFHNTHETEDRILTLTDGADDGIAKQVIPPLGIWQPPAWNGMPMTGVKVGGSGTGIKARMWGWIPVTTI